MSKPRKFVVQDVYFHKAKAMGKRARSYFKIEEIDQRFHILRTGMHVLDLGAAPGSFCEYALEKIGQHGFVLGVDLTPIENLGPKERVQTIAGDIFDEEVMKEIQTIHPALFDALISDLAPKTTGVTDIDQYQSCELSYQVLKIADMVCKKGAYIVIKVFQGADFDELLRFAKRKCAKVTIHKPQASRDRSVEVYLVCVK